MNPPKQKSEAWNSGMQVIVESFNPLVFCTVTIVYSSRGTNPKEIVNRDSLVQALAVRLLKHMEVMLYPYVRHRTSCLRHEGIVEITNVVTWAPEQVYLVKCTHIPIRISMTACPVSMVGLQDSGSFRAWGCSGNHWCCNWGTCEGRPSEMHSALSLNGSSICYFISVGHKLYICELFKFRF